MAPKTSTTSLWTLVERMQTSLERAGFDDDAVDAAVTRGLEALLAGGGRRRRKPRRAALSFGLVPLPAEA